MAMFIHDHLIVDTDFIVCVSRCNGTQALDGQYALGILLALGTKGRQVFAEFESPPSAMRPSARSERVYTTNSLQRRKKTSTTWTNDAAAARRHGSRLHTRGA